MATTKKDDDVPPTQDSAAAEAADGKRVLVYSGNSYDIESGQPSPKALEYLALWSVDDRHMALVLYVREMLGQPQWDAWGKRHTSAELVDLVRAIDEALAPN